MAEMDAAARNIKRRKGGVLKKVIGKLEASLRAMRSGHFVVVAAEGDEPRKFVICLDLLNDPKFLELLKLAEEEFGFKQQGVIALPCRPEELQRILQNKKDVHSC